MTRPSLQRSSGREGGFSLVETLVAVVIFGLVLVAALDMLMSFTSAERDQGRVVVARDDVRLMLRELERDVTVAAALSAPPSSSAAPTTVDLSVSGQAVRWRSSGTTVVREVLSAPGGSVTSSRVVLRNLVVPAGASLFTYFDVTGVAVDPNAVAPSTLAACVSRVRVTVGAQPSGMDSPITRTVDFALRARDTAAGCPLASSSPPVGAQWSSTMAATGPLGWWRLAEASGTTAANASSATGLDGTWETAAGLARTTDGISPGNGAASFTGAGSPAPFVTLGSPAVVSGTQQLGWTVGAWVRPGARQPEPVGTVVRKGTGPGAFALVVGQDGSVTGRLGLEGGGRVGATSPAGVVRPSEWAFLVATYDSRTLRLYVNGSVVASFATTGTVDLGAAETVTIGAAPDRTARFVGTVDEVAFWSRSLNQREVSDLLRSDGAGPLSAPSAYETTVTGSSGLLGYWRLNESSGTSATDLSGNGRTGTITGTATRGGTSAVRDATGAPTTFDGASGMVQLPTLTIPSGSGFTVSAWVRTTDANAPVLSLRSAASENAVLSIGLGATGVGGSGTGRPYVIVRDDAFGGTLAVQPASAENDGNWVFLVATRTTTGTVTLYVDGVAAGTGASTTGSITGDLAGIGAERRWILQNSGSVGERYANATVQDVAVWTRALSAAEVATLHGVATRFGT